MNIRHDLDPELVKQEIKESIARNEKHRIMLKEQAELTCKSYEQAVIDGTAHKWHHAPRDPSYVDGLIDQWNNTSLTHYSKVRVIEMPGDAAKRFLLVYGDRDDATVTTGTGPFRSLEKATEWFFNNGR